MENIINCRSRYNKRKIINVRGKVKSNNLKPEAFIYIFILLFFYNLLAEKSLSRHISFHSIKSSTLFIVIMMMMMIMHETSRESHQTKETFFLEMIKINAGENVVQ